jgi:glycosyltransferase involved in cell wall biosynthesis
MKIVHISTQDYGGAGKAAYRLNSGLNQIGIDSKMIVLGKQSGDPAVIALPDSDQLTKFSCLENEKHVSKILQGQWNRWAQTLSLFPKRPKGVELFSDTFSFTHLENCVEIQEADIINLHWVAGILNYDMMLKTFKDKPVVWTLHDMNAFTGGCHYAGDCIKYKSICGSCQQLGSVYVDDLSSRVWTLKNNIYSKLDLHVVTPSKWLADCARQSALLAGKDIRVIANGFPLEKFKPFDKTKLKLEIGLTADIKIILFGAESIANQRKGFLYLLNALEKIEFKDNSKIKLGIFGSLPNGTEINTKFEVINFGSINSEEDIAKVYSIADVFVIPSLEDNLPNTVVESMACGTPVVGFNIGGIPDMVTHLKTGYLVKLKDVEDLAEGIKTVLLDLDAEELSANCIQNAVKNYKLANQAQKYSQLYNSLLNDTKIHFAEQKELNEAENLIESGEYEVAKKILLSLLEDNDKSVDALNDLAVIYILKNEYNTAEEYIHSVLTIEPGNKIARENLRYINESNDIDRQTESASFNEENLPKITIVTPSFNQGKFLEECILSVISQGYPNLEYIIMDGGSSDGSVEIIQKYEKHLYYWQSKPDGGQYSAIEAGLNKGNGEILGWINSDDRLYPQSLQTIASIFCKSDKAEWITGRPSMFNEFGNQLFRINLPVWSQERYLNKDYKFIQQECTFWRKSLWDKAGSKLNAKLNLAGDLELWTRFFRNAQLYTVDAFLGGFRKQPAQKTSTRLQEYMNEAEKILDLEIAEFGLTASKPGKAPSPIFLDKDYLIPIESKVKPEILMETLNTWLDENDYDSAKSAFDQLLMCQPNSAELIEVYAEFLYKTNNTSDAKILLWNLIGRFDVSDSVFEKLLKYENEDCRFDNALSLLQIYKSTHPSTSKFNSEFDRLSMLHKLFNTIAAAYNLFIENKSQLAVEKFKEVFRLVKYLFDDEKSLIRSEQSISEGEYRTAAIKIIRLMEQIKMDEAVEFIKEFASSNDFLVNLSESVKTTSQSEKVLLSAIVSTYNSENFIKGCMDDLLNQTIYSKGELEIVVINSGSEQDEERIIKDYQSKYSNIKYIRTEERETIYQAWNRGIKTASGKYVTNANTDDRHRNDAYEIMLKKFKEDDSIDMVYANIYQTKTPNDTFYSTAAKSETKWIDYDPDLLLFGCFLGPQPMWKKSLHEKFGYFDETLKVVGDYEFWLRISRSANIHHIDEALGLYLYADSSAEHRDQNLTNEENIIVQKKYFSEFIQNENDIDRVLQKLNEINKIFNNEQYYKTGVLFLNGRKKGIDLQIRIHDFAFNFSAGLNGNTENVILSLIKEVQSPDNILAQNIYLEVLYSFLGSYFLMIKDFEKAQQNFEIALNYNPESSEACAGLGEVFYNAEIYDSAKTMFEWAIKYNSENTFARNRLSEINKDFSSEQSNDTDEADKTKSTIDNAEQLIAENKFDEARRELNNILNNSSNNIDALNDLSVVEILCENYEEAAKTISKVLDFDPQNEIAIENLDYLKSIIDEQLTKINSNK